MPPKSAKNAHDDGKGDGVGTKDKAHGGGASSSKMRRGASSTGGSQLREVTNASSTTKSSTAKAAAANAHAASKDESQQPGIDWATFDRDMLHTYRRDHRLATPTSYSSSYRHMVLSQPGSIGRYSPTMLRRPGDRRQSREQLSQAVRKHFNAMGVQENDVIVDFIHRVRSHSISKCDRQRRPAPTLDAGR